MMAVSNDSLRGGYCGSGVRGASEKYPSRLAASAARASASVMVALGVWGI